MKKILIVDDEDDFRDIIKDILIDEGFSPVESPSGSNALEMFKKYPFDAVLLDLRMPEMDGIETMKELRKMNSRIPIIILTAFGDIPTAVEAVKLGAYDFITKPPEFDKLIPVIRRAVETGRQREVMKDDIFALSPREKEVLKWLVEGKSTWDISRILHISRNTVNFHIKNLFQKLNVINRTQAVSEALRRGIISDE
jgi:DNA-binding NarL/FixJ family response regulator